MKSEHMSCVYVIYVLIPHSKSIINYAEMKKENCRHTERMRKKIEDFICMYVD